ncbi:histidine--tRNA ligase [Patescibacteria group bacterium]|nr:histidine--tRNA ligase [Patescibacteria group bacterium]
MKNEALQMAKGVRDFGPAEKIARDKILDTFKIVFESFGYNPIETPVIERQELFASKFGIGQESEAMNETFKLNDQGGRDLVLRTEFTVPFARYVGMNPQLRLPFKRYQMGTVFRDGPIKLGRYREFWQCDVDVVGVSNPLIDAEIIELANEVFQRLGLAVEIRINNRKILNAIMDYAGVPEENQISVIISIDKLDKIGIAGVREELLAKEMSEEMINKVLSAISIKGTNNELIEKLRDMIGDNGGISEVDDAIKNTISSGNIVFSPSLARGLAYYTGNVFEVYLKDRSRLSSAICAGGRFDEMIGGFIGGGESFPAVGISFGLEAIFDALRLQNAEFESQRSVVEVYVIPIGNVPIKTAFEYCKKLREANIFADLDVLSRKTGKNLEYASSYGIPWAILLGEDELKENKLTLRDMLSGEQEKLSFDEVVAKLKK